MNPYPYFISVRHAEAIFGVRRIPDKYRVTGTRGTLGFHVRTDDMRNLYNLRTTGRPGARRYVGAPPNRPWPAAYLGPLDPLDWQPQPQSFDPTLWRKDSACFGLPERLVAGFPHEPGFPGHVLDLHYQVISDWLVKATLRHERYSNPLSHRGQQRWVADTLDFCLYRVDWTPRPEPQGPTPPRMRRPDPRTGRQN